MKRLCCLIITISAVAQFALLAAPAYPDPVTVKQPDGSLVTIRLHGDEYLNWITWGNSLVVRAEDGYFHLAEFNDDGLSVPTDVRIDAGKPVPESLSGEGIVPPQSAIDKAQYARSLVGRSEASRNSSSRAPSIVKSSANSSISVGKDNRFLVILVEFSDVKFTVNGGGEGALEAFSKMLNQSGYSDNGAYGSARDYFQDNSLSVFIPQFDVYGPVTLDKEMTEYTSDGNYGLSGGSKQLMTDICEAIDPELDFSIYDIDKDGFVDNIFFFYAGYNSAEGADDAIWPHRTYMYGSISHDGKFIDGFACTSELKGTSGTKMCGIGTFCHEFGHVLGLKDIYDTNGITGGYYNDIRYYSLMSQGNYKSNGKIPPYLLSEERRMIGWAGKIEDHYLLDEATREYILPPVQTGEFYSSPTGNDGEYFTYEFRNGHGWDCDLDPGVVIFHVDHSNNRFGLFNLYRAQDVWSSNSVNAYSSHPCMQMEVAGSSYKPFGKNVHSFTSKTSPAAVSWAGTATGYDLTDIQFNSHNASFFCARSGSNKVTGYVHDSKGNAVSDASVAIAKNAVSSAPSLKNGISSKAPSKRPSLSPVTVTDENGYFEVVMDDFVSSDCQISVYKDGYIASTYTFDYTAGLVQRNFTLQKLTIESDIVLKKYGQDANNVLGGANENNLYAVMSYKASEISQYGDYQIDNVSFKVNFDSDVTVSLIIISGDVAVYEKDVTSLITSGTLSTVDISDAGIKIDPLYDLKIGYKVSASSFSDKYPLFYEDAEIVNGANLYSADGYSWSGWSYGNFIISAGLSYPSEVVLNNSGVNYIQQPNHTYSAGDEFVLKIVKSTVNPYSSVVWTVNSITKSDGETITLGTGITDITATLTYPSSRRETIHLRIVTQ